MIFLTFFSVTQNNCQEATKLSSESLLFLHVSNNIVFPSHHLFFLTLQYYCILKNVFVNTFCMMLYDQRAFPTNNLIKLDIKQLSFYA